MTPTPTPVRTSCVITATPRTGSWLLSAALHATELAGAPEEYFQVENVPSLKVDLGLKPSAPLEAYLARVVAYSTTPNGVFSTKLHWSQFEWLLYQYRTRHPEDPAADHELVARWFPNPRYVHMQRRDTARQAVSYYRAVRSATWFVVAGQEEEGADDLGEPDLLQVRWCEDMMIANERSWQAFYAEAGVRPFTIVYEDFAADYQPTVQAVLDYLGIVLPPGTPIPPPGVKKQSDGRSEELLAAYLAVRDTLPPMPEGAYWSRQQRKLVAPDGADEPGGAFVTPPVT